jgi:hypothetical protein
MNFHTGKIYNLPSNFYFYKSNQPRLWMEYSKKIKIPDSAIILEHNTSCIEYYKNIIIFSENDEIIDSESDDDSWVDMKKYL